MDSICAGVRELEKQDYVVWERVRNPNGQLGAIKYTILEQPRPPKREKPAQLNKDISNTEILNPIQSNPQPLTGTRMGTDGMGAREIYREIILENIGYAYLIQDSHIDREQLDELIVNTVCSV